MGTRPLKILHVDDDPGQALMMQAFLKAAMQEPYELVPAITLTAAIVRLAETPFDVVLLDLGLPDSRGLATFDAVKAHAPDSAIIVFTGESDGHLAIKALHGGAQDYLVKGEVDRHRVVRAIRYATERKQVEIALAGERDLLQSLLESLPDHIYVKDAAGRFLRANSAVARFFGFAEPEQLLGRTDFDLFPHGLAQQFFDEEQRVIHSGQSLLNREALVTASDGSARWELTTKAAFRDYHGRIIGTVGINRDITSLKKAEEDMQRANAELARSQAELQKTVHELQKAHSELRAAQMQLVEAEKMRTIGRLAAGVAHEVKNPLAIMLRGINYLAKSPVAREAAIGPVLRDMEDAIGRADAVIRGLLDFAAPQVLEAKAEDLAAVIEKSLSYVQHDLSESHVSLVKQLDARVPSCRMDRQKMQEVFINVFENAIHSMPGGGTLTVRTSTRMFASGGANVGESNLDRFQFGDALAIVDIEDTGAGVPADKLGSVFEPFFTTKPTGEGTGLGLSVCKTIMDLHGGTIAIRNRAEGGACVTIILRAGA